MVRHVRFFISYGSRWVISRARLFRCTGRPRSRSSGPTGTWPTRGGRRPRRPTCWTPRTSTPCLVALSDRRPSPPRERLAGARHRTSRRALEVMVRFFPAGQPEENRSRQDRAFEQRDGRDNRVHDHYGRRREAAVDRVSSEQVPNAARLSREVRQHIAAVQAVDRV